ncbi:DUF1376 domain-containing protein [Alysiella crassa]|nr:DUF1376 domain-containing protein [Alysiella crassa]
MFHIQDFHGRTWHLDNLARWIYRDLISLYYQNEKPLVDDLNELAHKIRCRTDEEKTALREVLAEFFTLKKGKYHHSRIDREIKNYQYRRNKPAMMKRLADLGVAFDKSMSVSELSALLAMYDDENLSNAHNDLSNGASNEPSNGMSNESNAMSNAERQALHRQKQRENLLLELKELGVNPDKSMSLNGLKNLREKARNDLSNGASNEPSNGENLSNGESNGKNSAITNNQEPVTKKEQQQQTRAEKNFRQPEKTIDLPAPFDRFAMHGNWQPADLGMVNGLLRRAGLPNCETGLMLDAALDFVAYWAGRPETEQTAAQWDSEFVRSAARFRAKHGHNYDKATWELLPTSMPKEANHAPKNGEVQPSGVGSKTKQSLMTLSAIRQEITSGGMKSYLPVAVNAAIVDGLTSLVAARLKYPPPADSWVETFRVWHDAFEHCAKEIRFNELNPIVNAENVAQAFQAAKNHANQADEAQSRFPSVRDVIGHLPKQLVREPERQFQPEKWQQEQAEGKAKSAELLKHIGKGRIQAA